MPRREAYKPTLAGIRCSVNFRTGSICSFRTVSEPRNHWIGAAYAGSALPAPVIAFAYAMLMQMANDLSLGDAARELASASTRCGAGTRAGKIATTRDQQGDDGWPAGRWSG